MDESEVIAELLGALARSRFRSSFKLSQPDKTLAREKGLLVMRQHAEEILSRRLFPSFPPNDGRQTPMRGYPVFVAQHATATCCRSCLQKWHRIPQGRELTALEQKYVLDVICSWISGQLPTV